LKGRIDLENKRLVKKAERWKEKYCCKKEYLLRAGNTLLRYPLDEEPACRGSPVAKEDLKKGRLYITFQKDLESELCTDGYTILSAQVMFAIFFEEKMSDALWEKIFRQTMQMSYASFLQILDRGERNSILLQLPSTWKKLRMLLQDLWRGLEEQGALFDLMLQSRLLPICHRMFDSGIRIDREMLQQLNQQTRHELQQLLLEQQMETQPKEIVLIAEKIKKLQQRLKEWSPQEMKDDRMEVEFATMGTATMRLTTHNKNVLGMPAEYRVCLKADRRCAYIEYDIHCFHLVLLALLAQDDRMLEKLDTTEDIYCEIAHEVFKPKGAIVTKEHRKAAKKMALVLLNGGGCRAVQDCLDQCDVHANAKDAIAAFWELFPSAHRFLLEIQKKKELVLPSGLRIDVQGLEKPHQVVSRMLQRCEVEIMIQVLHKVTRKLEKEFDAKVVLWIHDGIIVRMHPEQTELVSESIRDIISTVTCNYFNQKNLRIRVKEKIL